MKPISRRSFLAYLSAAVPVVATSVLVEPQRTIFLPPRGGWGAWPEKPMGLSPILVPPDGRNYVTLRGGDQIEWTNSAHFSIDEDRVITGTDLAGSSSFDYRIHDGNGWGTWATAVIA